MHNKKNEGNEGIKWRELSLKSVLNLSWSALRPHTKHNGRVDRSLNPKLYWKNRSLVSIFRGIPSVVFPYHKWESFSLFFKNNDRFYVFQFEFNNTHKKDCYLYLNSDCINCLATKQNSRSDYIRSLNGVLFCFHSH